MFPINVVSIVSFMYWDFKLPIKFSQHFAFVCLRFYSNTLFFNVDYILAKF